MRPEKVALPVCIFHVKNIRKQGTAIEPDFSNLNSQIVACRLCPRLVHHRESVPSRACFTKEIHWRKPVPGFGDPNAWLLILGLAPSPDGGNRTGRIFTGDASAKFLIRNLYEAGFANQPESLHQHDGLILKGCYLTAAVKCVPPKHRPKPDELKHCSRYLERELLLLPRLRCVLTLGQIAFQAYKQHLGVKCRSLKFAHGAKYQLPGAPPLYASYHPSPQNTNTGVLTDQDFQKLLKMCLEEKGSTNQ